MHFSHGVTESPMKKDSKVEVLDKGMRGRKRGAGIVAQSLTVEIVGVKRMKNGVK